jgi:hypothetical protein
VTQQKPLLTAELGHPPLSPAEAARPFNVRSRANRKFAHRDAPSVTLSAESHDNWHGCCLHCAVRWRNRLSCFSIDHTMCTGHDLALTAFREGLRETGYVEGHNVQIDYRWSGEQRDLLLALTADLVRPQRDRDLQRSWQRAWLRVGSALAGRP